MDPAKLDAVLQFALYAASDEDEGPRGLTVTSLVKYAYLADLAHAEFRGGRTFTGVEWVFLHFGPWAQQVQDRIPEAMQAIGAQSAPVSGEHQGTVWFNPDPSRRAEIEQRLPPLVKGHLKQLVHEYGQDLSRLLQYVYSTAPMRHCRPRQPIDFSVLVMEEPAKPQPPQRSVERTQLSDRKKKQLFQELKRTFREALQRSREAEKLVPPDPPPLFDEIFFRGQEWLDSLAGEPPSDSSGTLIIDDSVWDSDARTKPELP